MMTSSIPQFAGITGILSAGGMDSAAVHDWFHRPRRELAWLTPAIDLMENAGSAASRVLDLARADIVALTVEPELRVTVLGAGCEHRWRGTVHLAAGPARFALDRDDASCPECGGNAACVLFGADLAGEASDAAA